MKYKIGDWVWLVNGKLVEIYSIVSKHSMHGWYKGRGNRSIWFGYEDITKKANVKFKGK